MIHLVSLVRHLITVVIKTILIVVQYCYYHLSLSLLSSLLLLRQCLFTSLLSSSRLLLCYMSYYFAILIIILVIIIHVRELSTIYLFLLSSFVFFRSFFELSHADIVSCLYLVLPRAHWCATACWRSSSETACGWPRTRFLWFLPNWKQKTRIK